jgi:ArsR family transcriptional regulator
MNFPINLANCCQTVLSSCLKPDEAAQIAAIFRVLGEPARLQLLSFIANRPQAEATVTNIN